MSSTPRWSEEEEEAHSIAAQAQIKASQDKIDKQRELEALPARVAVLEKLVAKLEKRVLYAEIDIKSHTGRC